jgi:hypothetical protein
MVMEVRDDGGQESAQRDKHAEKDTRKLFTGSDLFPPKKAPVIWSPSTHLLRSWLSSTSLLGHLKVPFHAPSIAAN